MPTHPRTKSLNTRTRKDREQETVMAPLGKDGNRGGEGAQRKRRRTRCCSQNSSVGGGKDGKNGLMPVSLHVPAPGDKPNRRPRARMPSKGARPQGSRPGPRAEGIMDLEDGMGGLCLPKKEMLGSQPPLPQKVTFSGSRVLADVISDHD